jgi:hypothetical protein
MTQAATLARQLNTRVERFKTQYTACEVHGNVGPTTNTAPEKQTYGRMAQAGRR